MQKQQLEQIQQQQQQQQANDITTTTNTQVLVIKTLDQASAQFAASALLTTDQLLALKSKEEGVLGSGVNGVLPSSGVYKGLHISSTTASSPHHTNQSSPPIFLQPSTNTTTLTPVSGTLTPPHAIPLGHLGNAANSAAPNATQVLLGNNIRLSVPAGRHIPRTLGGVSPSALKLASATNCQMPKVTGTATMDMGSRDNHDQDKPALTSLADNTVAMEVT